MFGTVKDNEANKFRGNALFPKVAITDESGLLGSTQFDDVQVLYPSNVSETYSYYYASVLQKTIEITYTSICKSNIERIRVTYAI